MPEKALLTEAGSGFVIGAVLGGAEAIDDPFGEFLVGVVHDFLVDDEFAFARSLEDDAEPVLEVAELAFADGADGAVFLGGELG